MSSRTDIALGARSALEGIARGATLDATLHDIAAGVAARFGAGSCKIWLVKQGDICRRCVMARTCEDRTMCLHLKSAIPESHEDRDRVPLAVFRDRAFAKGGCGRVGDPRSAARLLFHADEISAVGGDAFAAAPLLGPAGVIGLLGVLRTTALSLDELEVLSGFADEAVVAVRIADLTSRYQRTALQLEDAIGAKADVEGLLHSILFGSPEYDVIAEDLDGNITVFSEGARTTYGYGPDELIGRVKADILYAPEEIESGRIVEILTEAMASGRCEAVVTRLRKNGERFPARATFTVRRDADGDPSGFVIVERDLTMERNSARLTASSIQHVAQLQDHLQLLKSRNALLEDDLCALRDENDALRARILASPERDVVAADSVAARHELRSTSGVAAQAGETSLGDEPTEVEQQPSGADETERAAATELTVVTYTPRDRIAFTENRTGRKVVVRQCADASLAVETADASAHSVLVVDCETPDGWQLVGAIRSRIAWPPFVVIGGTRDRGRALKEGAWAFLERPLDAEGFGDAVWRAADARQTRVLVVASDNDDSLIDLCEHSAFAVSRIENWRVARDRMIRGEVDVVIVDTTDASLRGVEMLDWLAGELGYLRYPVVLLAANVDALESKITGARPASLLPKSAMGREAMLAAIDRAVVR